MPIVSTQVYCLTAKFGSFLDHAETGEKGQNVISSSVQHLISFIFAIHVSFIIIYQWCGFCWQSLGRNLWPPFVYIAVLLDWKNKHIIGVLGTNVATISWLHFARYNWPHSFTARCCKRQISCHNKRYIQSRPCTGEVQTRHKYWHLTCTLLCCDYSTLWEALHANMVEIGARCSDKNVKILGRYQWIGW